MEIGKLDTVGARAALRDITPADLIALVAGQAPGAQALAAPCGTLDYATLDARAARLAGHMRAMGIRQRALIGICLDRSFEGIVAALAAWKAGAAYLPLDPAWPDARLQALAADAGLAAIVGKSATAARLAGIDVPLIALDRDAAAIEAAEPLPHAPLDPQSLAYVIYTSGSTGTPKGVEVTHANLAHLIAWHHEAFAVTAGDRASHIAGLGFDAAAWEIWPHLCAGACVALIEEGARTAPERLRDWLLAERITIAFAPPALAEPLLDMAWPADTALRILLTGADVLKRRPPAGLPFALVNNYGPTECTVVATSATVEAGGDGLPTIGRPIAGTLIRLIDEDGAESDRGEIYIGGGSVARGYRGRPDLTALSFITREGERLYRTGDLGERRPDGEIVFWGRRDAQVKIRGHRVEPEEAAAVLARHPDVTACAVIARADGDGEMHLVGYVVPGAATPFAEALRDHLAAHLPDYYIPARFVRLDALPLNSSGKVDRAALPAPDEANALPASAHAAPETPAEIRLAEILEEALGHGPVGIDDNFFLLGGHSLLGTQVVLRANEAFGVDLQLRDLFRAPTIRQLAALIEDALLALIEAMSDKEAQSRAAE